MTILRLRRRGGQTLIETALILFLLLLVVFGITEFARAWFVKNSLKNAARTGARVAVVTPDIVTQTNVVNSSDPADTSVCVPLTGNAKVFCYIWTSPGIRPGATASLTIDDTNGDLTADEGETVAVSVSMDFETVVPRIMGSFIPTNFSADASMRYE